jgi:hypothetical protein
MATNKSMNVKGTYMSKDCVQGVYDLFQGAIVRYSPEGTENSQIATK